MKDAPATKKDLQLLKAGIDVKFDATQQDVQKLAKSTDARFDAVESRLDRLDGQFTRMAIDNGNLKVEIRDLKVEFKQDVSHLNSWFHSTMDVYATRMETLWRESALNPRMIDEFGSMLRDHESRLRRLETPHAP